jgi:hypothetical protein
MLRVMESLILSLLILIASRSHRASGPIAEGPSPVGRLPASRSPAATRLTQFTEKGGFKAPSFARRL